VPELTNTPNGCDSMPGTYNLDIPAVLDRVGGDEELLREITAIFLDDYPNLIAEIREAIEKQDHKRLEVAAHTLKGSVANFGAQDAMQAAYRLELLGRSRQLLEAPDALRVLEAQFSVLQPALEKLRQ
jgi:HPt (histidine-containing phosphotransfer) domain-containing protein